MFDDLPNQVQKFQKVLVKSPPVKPLVDPPPQCAQQQQFQSYSNQQYSSEGQEQNHFQVRPEEDQTGQLPPIESSSNTIVIYPNQYKGQLVLEKDYDGYPAFIYQQFACFEVFKSILNEAKNFFQILFFIINKTVLKSKLSNYMNGQILFNQNCLQNQFVLIPNIVLIDELYFYLRMSGIEIRWNILKEEGRVIKAAADLLKLQCKFVPQEYYEQQQKQLNAQHSKTIISSIQDIKGLPQMHSINLSLFGNSQEEKANIQNKLANYRSNFEPFLRFSIFDLINQNSPQKRIIKINDKKQTVENKIRQFDLFLGKIQTKFICGNTLSIIDLLFYFDVCNMTYFGKNPSNYANIWKWFQSVYRYKQVKIITHQWFAMAKQITPLFRLKRNKSKL